MITTVLFDLGNVILPFDVMRLADRLTAYTHLDAKKIVDTLWNDHIADNFETGRMSSADYFSHVSTLCQFNGLSYETFIPFFNQIFDENKDVFELIERLKGRYKLGVISNTNPIHRNHLTQTYPVLAHFDRHWWSDEAGVRKPDPAIYRMALDHFGVPASQAVFIDDLPVNIASARALGINAIHFQDYASLKTELTKLGVQHECHLSS